MSNIIKQQRNEEIVKLYKNIISRSSINMGYLHRDAIVLPSDTEKGYVLIKHEGLPLGFVKNLGNRCNSLHPQSRRIRMDINR